MSSTLGWWTTTAIGLVGFIVVIKCILIFALCTLCKLRNRRRPRPTAPSPPPSQQESKADPYGVQPQYSGVFFSKSMFTCEELATATDNFSNANLLGEGGFGFVHKGVLPGGKEVAVKLLKEGTSQGEREFQAEAEIITRVHHKHLVSLVGYCIAGAKKMLVYEFVPNNTMKFHLHGNGRHTMDWPTRLRIALGAAKGLAYLHEDCHPKIVHRDIKAANILLDCNFEAKIADFGLAKLFFGVNTHVSTQVKGTFGCMDPEYASSRKLTDKSDVFSFGVMLLELITGRHPIFNTRPDDLTPTYLANWARPLLTCALENGNYDSLVDARLQRHYNTNEMARMVACAAACVCYSAQDRPRMSQVVRALEGDLALSYLNQGIRPGCSTIHDKSQYNEEIEKHRKMEFGSKEYGSSNEYSNPSGSNREMEIEKV